MNVQETDSFTIKLKGGNMYLTGDPNEVFRVDEGELNIYIVRVSGTQIGRSIYLCDAPTGCWIPSLSLVENGKARYWQFLLKAKDTARLTLTTIDNSGENLEEIRDNFLSRINKLPATDARFSVRMAEWYESVLEQEESIISRIAVEKKAVRAGKINMMLSVFKQQSNWKYQEHTDNALYNAMSIYCDYMNVKICSYQTLCSTCGDDFNLSDIARVSHFIVRNVMLGERWYRRDSGPLVAYRKDSGQPVICIPKGINRYVLYDAENNTDFLIDAKEAETLQPDGIMIYRSLPSRALKFKDILRHGMISVWRRDVAAFVLMTLLGVLVGLLLPVLNEMMFDKLIPMGSQRAITEVGYVIFACAIGNVFFLLVKNLSMMRATKTVEYSIMNATIDRLFHLPQHFLEQYGSTDLVTRVMSMSSIFQTMSTGLIEAVLGFVFSIFYVVKMFQKSKALAGRGLIMVLITIVVISILGYARLSYERKKLETSSDANVTLYQFISSIMKVKISGVEDRALLEYQKHNTKTILNDIKSSYIANAANVFRGMINMFYSGFIYYTLERRKLDLTIGEYTSFNTAFGLFVAASMQLVNFFLMMGMVIPAYKRVKPIYDQPTELDDDVKSSGRFYGNVEVDHLDFRYGADETLVLKDISFKIAAGEYIGIVGASGCGKSTLLKCLLGFETASKGKIYYDNKDIETLDKRELRKQMGVVIQDGRLTSGTILSNIEIASPGISVERVLDLMREVGMKEEIDHMPMGIYTEISEYGSSISGGQQQRILIARALANNPVMIFFDEATSALDNITQQQICENLEEHHMTRVMIAHRLTTVQKCDRILVMDSGSIVETGSYEELLQKKGLFYELVKRQQVDLDNIS